MKKDVIDYYGLLELDFRASPEVIEVAYGVLKNKFSGDENILSQLQEAYVVLKDEDRRREYDTERNMTHEPFLLEYENISRIAESEYGFVYVATHLLSGEKVCIKHCRFVSPQYEEIVIKEMRATWNLDHHNVVFARDFKKLNDGTLALIMRYRPGFTLKEVIEQIGMMDAERVMRIAERISNVIMYLHSKGTVHGGLEPRNIIIDPETNDVSLISFGLSMVKPKAGDRSAAFIKDFSPPEQERYEALIPESDYYGLGMLIMYMLGGGIEAVRKIQIPSDTPREIKQFLKELIQRDPDDRPQYRSRNIFNEIKEMRIACFGREHSFGEMLPEFRNKNNL